MNLFVAIVVPKCYCEGMRSDAKKNLKIVTTELLKDPLATRDSIAERTGLSQGNVSDKLTKIDGSIERNKRTISIAAKDWDIVEKSQELTRKWQDHIENPTREDIDTNTRAGQASQKRASFLMGENADPDGGEKEFIIKLPDVD